MSGIGYVSYGILLVWCVMGNAPFGQGGDQGLEGVLCGIGYVSYGILLVWCVMGNAPFGQEGDQGLEGVLW
nr:hypothetical protein CFP56_03603 [Quercus suber]